MMNTIKKKSINLALLILLLCSCSPVFRHDRLVKKYPFVHKVDTVFQKETLSVLVPEVRVDSVFQKDTFLIKLNDTIYLTKERLKVELYKIHDSIYINANCDTIVVTKEIIKKIPVIHKNEDFKNSKSWIVFLGVLILLIFFVLMMFLKKMIQ